VVPEGENTKRTVSQKKGGCHSLRRGKQKKVLFPEDRIVEGTEGHQERAKRRKSRNKRTERASTFILQPSDQRDVQDRKKREDYS